MGAGKFELEYLTTAETYGESWGKINNNADKIGDGASGIADDETITGHWSSPDTQNVRTYGAVGNGSTDDMSAINDAISAANNGAVYFPSGTYRIASSPTIGTPCVFAKGATISVDVDQTVTFTGQIISGNYQIFDGDGVVSFSGNYLMEKVVPQWWGAVGDDSTDNAAALNKCSVAANTGGIEIVFPKGTYRFSTTVTFGVSSNIDMTNATMKYIGAADAAVSAIIVGDTTGVAYPSLKTYKNLNVWRVTLSDWSSESDIGLKLLNLDDCKVSLGQTFGFCVNIQMIGIPSSSASRGFRYNHIDLGLSRYAKIELELTNAADNGAYSSYCNENIFDGGNFSSTGTGQAGIDRYGVIIRANAGSTSKALNSNKFHGSCFELGSGAGDHERIGIRLEDGATQNIFDSVRHEGNDTLFVCEDDTFANKCYQSYGHVSFRDNSSYAGSNICKALKTDYSTEKTLLYKSGDLSEKCMWVNPTQVGLPAPLFYRRYNGSTYGYKSSYFDISSLGLGYATGTLLGVGLKIDTRSQKSFMLDWEANVDLSPFFVCYDSNGDFLDADAGTYWWTIDSAYGTNKQPYFVPSGKCYYFSASSGNRPFRVHDDVHYVDIIFGINSGKWLKSFGLYALGHAGIAQICEPYQIVGAWGECQGTAPPTKYWKNYKRGRVLHNAELAVGSPMAWGCVFSLDTTLTDGEPLGETSMLVGTSADVANADIVGVVLDDDSIDWTTVAAVPDGTHITLTDALTGAAGSGNAVYVFRWAAGAVMT